MSSRLKNVIKDAIPPIFIRLARKFRPVSSSLDETIHFVGKFKTWEDAAAAAGSSYSSSFILESVRIATGKVRDGLAVATRDGVIFDSPQWNFPLIASLF